MPMECDQDKAESYSLNDPPLSDGSAPMHRRLRGYWLHINKELFLVSKATCPIFSAYAVGLLPTLGARFQRYLGKMCPFNDDQRRTESRSSTLGTGDTQSSKQQQ